MTEIRVDEVRNADVRMIQRGHRTRFEVKVIGELPEVVLLDRSGPSPLFRPYATLPTHLELPDLLLSVTACSLADGATYEPLTRRETAYRKRMGAESVENPTIHQADQSRETPFPSRRGASDSMVRVAAADRHPEHGQGCCASSYPR